MEDRYILYIILTFIVAIFGAIVLSVKWLERQQRKEREHRQQQ